MKETGKVSFTVTGPDEGTAELTIFGNGGKNAAELVITPDAEDGMRTVVIIGHAELRRIFNTLHGALGK